ncbi:hypothetical protein TNCV_3976081 [Trichonephila clavipes]|nr:hypothetical protein TNCV_3976081 [Trichonephila clavipes]
MHIVIWRQNHQLRGWRTDSSKIIKRYKENYGTLELSLPDVKGLQQPSGQGIGSRQACHEFDPSTTKDSPCRERNTLNLSRAEMSSCWCGS